MKIKCFLYVTGFFLCNRKVNLESLRWNVPEIDTVHVCRGRVNSHSLIEWTSQGLARKTETPLCVLDIKRLIEN